MLTTTCVMPPGDTPWAATSSTPTGSSTLSAASPSPPVGPRLPCWHQDLHFAAQLVAEPVLLDLEIVAGLEVQPEALQGPEVTRQPRCGIRRHRACRELSR
jgi:hypothetical protein